MSDVNQYAEFRKNCLTVIDKTASKLASLASNLVLVSRELLSGAGFDQIKAQVEINSYEALRRLEDSVHRINTIFVILDQVLDEEKKRQFIDALIKDGKVLNLADEK